MAKNELVRSKQELEDIANLMLNEIKMTNEDIISRYIKIVSDSITFFNGKKLKSINSKVNINKEMMKRGIFTQTNIDDLLPYNIKDVFVARDLEQHRFNFTPKGIPLPTSEKTYFEAIPSNINIYDAELKEFTKEHPKTILTRTFTIEQRIVVNSNGGIAIQSIPFLGISYSHGYQPVPTRRDINVVCTTKKDVKRLPKLIKFIADPTPDKKIKNADSFTKAFHELYSISKLEYGSLEEANIPSLELYDVIMLTGVPVHEIFGHHFEEPSRYLEFGESGTFKYGQNITNKDLILTDNPQQKIENFRVNGFTYFDAYGRPRTKRVHIKDGKIKEFLGSEYVDSEKLKNYLNLEFSNFVGNATQYDDGMFPQARMSCTVIDGKQEKIDLEGKLLVVPHEGYTHPQNKTYAVNSFESYVIQNEVTKRTIPLQITGGINQALANIVLLEGQSYQTGICEKPEIIYYPQSRGPARAPVSQFARNQMWKGQQVYPLPISNKHLRILQSTE